MIKQQKYDILLLLSFILLNATILFPNNKETIEKAHSHRKKNCNIIVKLKNTNSIDNTNILFQNHPNPSNDGTTIRYSISNTDNSYINIYNYNGVKVKEYKLDNNYGNIEILKNDLNSGSYIYTLYVNGIIIDSKKLIFQ